MKKILTYIFVLVSTITITSCEVVIKVDLEGSKPQLVVDAFINDSLAKQTIKLRLSKAYLDNGISPVVTGAEVTIEDVVGRKFVFTDDNNDGDYVWTPTATDIFPLGVPGLFYSLKIKISWIRNIFLLTEMLLFKWNKPCVGMVQTTLCLYLPFAKRVVRV
jgi:hypothetical protein